MPCRRNGSPRKNEKELDGAVRKHGLGSLREAETVVLEADGRLSVIGPDNAGNGAILPHNPED